MRQAQTRRVSRAPYDPGNDAVMVVRVLCVYRSEGHTALQLRESVWSLHLDDPVNRTVTNGNTEVSAGVFMSVVMLAHTVVHIFDQDARFPFIFVRVAKQKIDINRFTLKLSQSYSLTFTKLQLCYEGTSSVASVNRIAL